MSLRTRFAALTAAAASVLAFAGTAAAATHWVNDNGAASPPGTSCANPGYNQIQPAVDAAVAGDTIRVCAGDYAGDVEVNKQLFVRGNRAGVDARSRGTANESNVVGTDYAFSLEADDIVLDGFRIWNVSNGPGVYMRPIHAGVLVLNNIIVNNVFGIYANSAPGDTSVIRRNLIRDNNSAGSAAGNGIYTDQGTRDLLVERNKFQDQLNAGILMTTSGTFNVGNTIRRNYAVNNTTFVNLFGNNSDLLITDNETNDTRNADDADQGCVIRVDEQASGIRITHNNLRKAPFAGVCLRNGADLTVNYNRIKHSEFFGIDSSDSVPGAALVRGNRVWGGDGPGIHFGAATQGNTIRGNRAFGNNPDCQDESTGTGTAGTANTWINNVGRTASPRGICRRHK